MSVAALTIHEQRARHRLQKPCTQTAQSTKMVLALSKPLSIKRLRLIRRKMRVPKWYFAGSTDVTSKITRNIFKSFGYRSLRLSHTSPRSKWHTFRN